MASTTVQCSASSRLTERKRRQSQGIMHEATFPTALVTNGDVIPAGMYRMKIILGFVVAAAMAHNAPAAATKG